MLRKREFPYREKKEFDFFNLWFAFVAFMMVATLAFTIWSFVRFGPELVRIADKAVDKIGK